MNNHPADHHTAVHPSLPSLLLTGAAGGLSTILSSRLRNDFNLVGIDPRPYPPGHRFPGKFHQVRYTGRPIEEVFRQSAFDTLIHLGRIRVTSKTSFDYRYTQNVIGTSNILRLAHKAGVKRVIVFSTFHVYGAQSSNPLYITEDAPLRASQVFSELVDAVELDHTATTFMWRYPEIRTVVLRPANVVGSSIQNAISRFLASGRCPTLMGYDPLMQFIHAEDIARALECALSAKKSAVYNVAGEGVIPYSKAIEMTGSHPLPIPHLLAYPAIELINRFQGTFPKHLIDYFRYPVVLNDQAFRQDFTFVPKYSLAETLASLKS